MLNVNISIDSTQQWLQLTFQFYSATSEDLKQSITWTYKETCDLIDIQLTG